MRGNEAVDEVVFWRGNSTSLAPSALPPKADMCGATSDVCYGPEADIPLFDDVVGAPDECVRDVEAERLGRLQIDSQVYFCSLLDR